MMPPEECAAIFVEPIQGEGGYLPRLRIPAELRRICDRHGILLVADEVQSGAGRMANGGPSSTRRGAGHRLHRQGYCLWHASGHHAWPAREIMDWVPGSPSSTFGGNPVCIEAALATMDVLDNVKLSAMRKSWAAT